MFESKRLAGTHNKNAGNEINSPFKFGTADRGTPIISE